MAAVARDPITIEVTEPNQAGEARRAAVALAGAVGFDEQRRAEVAIVVTELATNLARHAKGGEIVLRSLRVGTGDGVEVLAIDRGPGVANLADSLRDGRSTGGTPGTGLGAVRRLSGRFDAFTGVPAGTVMLARLGPPADPAAAAPAAATPDTGSAVGVVCLPKKGEAACGDAWHVAELDGGRTVVLLADGLGHGLQAADASRRAVRLFRENAHLDPERAIALLHAELRGTRGAAVAVADLRRGQRELRFAGVGNIAASVVAASDGKSRSMVSHNGTVGAEVRRVQTFTYPWPDDGLLLMHSDGLGSQWKLESYPGLRFRDPSLIAGVLYRDFRRERDDVTILVLSTAAAADRVAQRP